MLILSQNVHNQLVNLQILKPEHQTEQRSHRSTNICFILQRIYLIFVQNESQPEPHRPKHYGQSGLHPLL